MGNDVLCLDLDVHKINILKGGGISIHEPGLLEMVWQNVAAGRLHFSTSIEESVAFGQVQFIAVGTPQDDDGSADLQYVIEAARNIARHMTDYKLVVDKSTIPVGTSELEAVMTKASVVLKHCFLITGVSTICKLR